MASMCGHVRSKASGASKPTVDRPPIIWSIAFTFREIRRVRLLLALLLLFMPAIANADPADIAAASRSVARVVVFSESDPSYPIGHGSGVVVAPNMILTNNHVVDENEYETRITLIIVPAEGSKTYEADIVDRSPGNDLALLRLRNGARMTPAAFYAGGVEDGADVFAIGYPGGVDVAQGLNLDDTMRPQVPVKTKGSISGGRSAKEFETLLHTAAIGAGNSGGPLVDACGRVVGINSFGTVSNGGDAEFFFAVANREVRNFLSRNKVTARSVDGPCLSRAELSRAEADRAAAEKAKIEAANREAETAQTKTMGKARQEAEYAIIEARENRILLTIILLLGALGAAGSSWQFFERERRDYGKLAAGAGAALLIAALLTWVTRPGFDQIDERARAVLKDVPDPAAKTVVAKAGAQICVIDRTRSRITVSDAADVKFNWSAGGCVNDRTQYAQDGGVWVRTLVPNNEQQVSIISFNPDTSSYRIERHLLGAEAMGKAREARKNYEVQSCSADAGALDKVAQMNRAVRELLPQQANEVLQFNCSGG
jgi:serine protease Do